MLKTYSFSAHISIQITSDDSPFDSALSNPDSGDHIIYVIVKGLQDRLCANKENIDKGEWGFTGDVTISNPVLTEKLGELR
jgi:hypothetical protein